MTGVLSQSFAEAFLAEIGPKDRSLSPLRVLDVGVGRARIPIEIRRRRPEIEITGIDCQPTILQRARRDIARAGLAGAIRVRQADAGSLPFADAWFDAVISNSLVHHLPRRREALSEMIRVLRPDGLLFVRDSLPQRDAQVIARILVRASAKRCRGVNRAQLPAPLTLDAARQFAAQAGIPSEWVRRCGSRHWLLSGGLHR